MDDWAPSQGPEFGAKS